MFDFYKELAKGGWVMIPIGSVSVLALGLFLERIFSLRRSRVFPPDLVRRVRELILARRFGEALALSQQSGSAMGSILAAGLLRPGVARTEIKEAVEERGRAEAGRLERFIEGLGTIAAIAPLLGLLGTVLGMIDVFRIVDNFTKANPGAPVDPGLLATGIWKALITTAAGLVVAIPTFVGYKFLGTRINRLILEMEESAGEITDLFVYVQHGDDNPAAAKATETLGATADAEGGNDGEESKDDSDAEKSSDKKERDRDKKERDRDKKERDRDKKERDRDKKAETSAQDSKQSAHDGASGE